MPAVGDDAKLKSDLRLTLSTLGAGRLLKHVNSQY